MLAFGSPARPVAALEVLAVVAGAWSAVVGGVVCPRGRWRDVPVALMAGVVALLAALFIVDVANLVINDSSGSPCEQAGTCADENGMAVGLLLATGVGAGLWVAMLPVGLLAAAGRRFVSTPPSGHREAR